MTLEGRTAGDALPDVKLLPPLDALPSSCSTSALPTTPTRQGSDIVLPCFPLDKDEDARIVPETRGIKLILTEGRYMEMMKHVEDSQKVFSRWSKCFVATQVIREDCEDDEEDGEGHEPLDTVDSSDDSQVPTENALVRLKGLQNASDLNGSLGKLGRFDSDKNRWEIQIGGGDVAKLVRPENFEILPQDERPLRRGSLVQIFGVQNSRELNGLLGKLLFLNPTTNRWDVDIEGGRGARSLKTENLQRVPRDTPHKAFSTWRTPSDVGGQWRLAEVGVVMHLEELKEVKVKRKKGAKAEKGYEVTLSAFGRAKILSVLNPEAFAEKTTYLRTQVQDFVDEDAEDDLVNHEKSRVDNLLRDVIQLQVSSMPKANVAIDGEMMRRLESTVQMNPGLWKLVGLWQSFLKIWSSAKKLSEIASGEEDITELQKKLKQTKSELSAAADKKIYETVPLQQMIQSPSHLERLRIFASALQKEKTQLEEKLEKVSLFDALNSPIQLKKGETWVPFGPSSPRSKL
eukprot:gnl/MRDRNA2_/MRDRNA2_105195_c0_seq1.p1 gnl/MRDRNA2_/MRDRNA2_105195_c0~~gnl/MRDRNA2_/MRDRNA2_105195_c0_seq1.p1  ORF type:complete len:529 (-),score=129.77 gnl/MRDRNA2_/MRDRNA2_105195_c0_seq1:270-1817(-)